MDRYLSTKAMRYGKINEVRYNFLKLYRESRKSKVGTFRCIFNKCRNAESLSTVKNHGIFWYNFWDFRPFLESFLTNLIDFGHFIDREMSKMSKITVSFWQILLIFENSGIFSTLYRHMSKVSESFGSFSFSFAKVSTVKSRYNFR